MSDEASGSDGAREENESNRFARLPATSDDRTVDGRASREEIVGWWSERFGLEPESFANHTFWEKGAGKIWVLAGDAASELRIEALGMRIMHTRQEHWKPTTNAVQRFGKQATRGVMVLDEQAAARFVSGGNQDIEWDGEWGYVIVAREIAGDREPLGVGLYTYGELKSQIAKGRRRDLG